MTVTAIVALLVAPTFAPQLLAFPYHAAAGGSDLWSEQPLPPTEVNRVMARRNALVASSPLARGNEPRHIFLTQGGWRWTWLALVNRGAFGVSRPGSEPVVINRSDLASDRVWNGKQVGGQRSLSGTIAHETCHGIERRHFGIGVDFSKPAWLREGYCDHVAQESSLSDADAQRIKASGHDHPALVYFEGRKRVADELRRNGGDIDRLFAAH